MKKYNHILLIPAVLALIVSCNKISYRKTKSGLVYKLFPANSKDSMLKVGQVAKYQITTKLNDSALFSSYGKLPGYVSVENPETPTYDFRELLTSMKKGDSLMTVMMIDTLLKKGQTLPFGKKGDRLILTIRIIEVFPNDSLARIDYNAEAEKDRPRMMKEQEEQMAKMEKEKNDQQLKEDMELEKSGEIARELQEMEAYLAQKNIKAQKTGKGTYVSIQEQGAGPFAEPGKYVNVKYTGKIMATDSAFQSNAYQFQLGKGAVIRGWDEGLTLFKMGGKGTIYIPGFLAYGKNPPQGSPFKPFEPLKFDVELLSVSDTMVANQQSRVVLKPKNK